MSQIAGKRSASCSSTKVVIPLLRVHRPCWMLLVLLTLLSSASGAYSTKNLPRSEEGTCRFDLMSVAVFSCVQPNGVPRPLSQSCCNALLHAIDQVPDSEVSGACCLCRYMKEKVASAGLNRAYVLCNGKDRHIIAKWSLFPIKKCSEECTKRSTSSVDMGTSGNEDSPVVRAEESPAVRAEDSPVVPVHGSGTTKGIWITVAVVIMMGAICCWYFRRFKAATKASPQRRTSSQEADHQAGHRRSVVPSSPAKLKERRLSSS
ncbi:unnamed protein product [Urochloa humidicola]